MSDSQTDSRIADFVCTACGCVCDDLTVRIEGERIVSFEPGCPLAERTLLRFTANDDVAARIEGRAVPLTEAVSRAAEILRSAHSPLIYGLPRHSTEGQRAAVRLADRLGACIDTPSSGRAASLLAMQTAGESTCTLGEVRHRSDLVIYWGCNPVISHPRHLERFVDAPGQFVPGGRRDRHVVVVDVQPTETGRAADSFLQVKPGEDFELLWGLRSLVRGERLQADSLAGIPRADIEALAHRMTSSRYGAVFFGSGLTRHGIPHLNVEALLRLVTDLHRHTRFVARHMTDSEDVAGAHSVLCWQTGFPFAVNLNRPYPRYNPGEFSADDLLRRGEVDAVLLIGTDGASELSPESQAALRDLPCIVLDSPGTRSAMESAVQFTTAVYGLHRPGTGCRMDDIPIPLHGVLQSALPADHEVLEAITEALGSRDESLGPPVDAAVRV